MKERNIVLPEPPAKGGVYAPCKISGTTAYISGCGCVIDGCEAFGKLGRDYTLEQGQAFAGCAFTLIVLGFNPLFASSESGRGSALDQCLDFFCLNAH